MIPAVILAGGQSRRMGGGDKSLLTLAGQPILSHVIERLKPQAGPMALNANGDPDRFQAFGLEIISDSIDGFVGPLAGVLAAMEWAAKQGASAVITVAADTPFFPETLVQELQRKQDNDKGAIVLAATQENERTIRHPTFGLWPTALADDLREALLDGTRKVVAWTDRYDCRPHVFDGDDPFFNINTPEDLVAAATRLDIAQ